jgi:hypothetical protein
VLTLRTFREPLCSIFRAKKLNIIARRKRGKSMKKIMAYPYNPRHHNGIVICCKCCGYEFEETDDGYYPPLEYEEEKKDRLCRRCRES